MSREDFDFEEDEERSRRQRRRRSYEEEEDYEAPRRRRGGSGQAAGSITGVGVITIILGSLMLLCGLCYSGIGLMAGAGAAGGGGPPGFPGLMGMAAGILIVVALLILIFGALYLAGGIGVVQRRNWGRIMTLVMAGFSGLFGILTIIGVISNLLQPTPPPQFGPGFQQGFQSGRIMSVLIGVVMMIVLFTHCIMSYVVLLNSRNASEFE